MDRLTAVGSAQGRFDARHGVRGHQGPATRTQRGFGMEHSVEEKKFTPKFFQAAKLFLYLLRYREIDQTFLLYDNMQDRQLVDRVIHCLEIARNYVVDNPIEFQHALHSKTSRAKRAADLATVQRIAARAANLLDEIRKYIVFEGSPDIIEVLNEFAEQHTEDSP
jgi:hypothetical protein